MKAAFTARITRWFARGWSILSVLFLLTLAIAEKVGHFGRGPTAQQWIGLALFPVGVCIGLVIAWYHEGLGGFLTLGCLAAFCVWNLVRSGHMPQGLFFFLIAAPGLLFLAAKFQSPR